MERTISFSCSWTFSPQTTTRIVSIIKNKTRPVRKGQLIQLNREKNDQRELESEFLGLCLSDSMGKFPVPHKWRLFYRSPRPLLLSAYRYRRETSGLPESRERP